jgi:Right handed beta helix region
MMMRNILFRSDTLAAMTCAALLVSPDAVLATSQRTFVSISGANNANCSLAQPCRSFDAALNATSQGGEVIVLDSGGYGATTITQSVSIVAPAGIYAGISVFAGSGVFVDAPGATVVLRGLSINNQGGSNGIYVTHAARVQIENCVINGMGAGVRFHPSSEVMVSITDTTLRNNGGNGVVAVPVGPGGELSRIQIFGSVMQANGVGVSIGDITRASIVDTVVADSTFGGVVVQSLAASSTNLSTAIDRIQIVGSGSAGVSASGTAAALAVANVSQSVVANNAAGVSAANAHAYIRLSANQITGNLQQGVVTAGGVIASMQNNLNSGNGAVSSSATALTPY